MALTQEQQEAVVHLNGNLQLIACAGSGKTEVVARHIANLLSPKKSGGGGLIPANVIAFTFTEKAAAELKQRVLERCRDAIPGLTGLAEMYIGTIHGFCLEILKTEVHEFLKYDVLDEVQQTLLVDRNSAKSGLTTSTNLNGQALKRFVDTPTFTQAMAILRESDLNLKALKTNSVFGALQSYENLLTEKGYLDYSSILSHAVRALARDKQLRARLKDRVRSVIVDEYQDVNPVQERLLSTLHDLGACVTVVGDDDQTIYQWRGSDVKNIMTFTARYGKSKTIKLEENFRSSEGITEVARLVIEKNAGRLPKIMRSAKQQAYDAGDIVALQLDNPTAEANYIAETCKALYGTKIVEGDRERAVSWSDMAILIRLNAMGEPIRRALRAKKIPVVSVGMSSLFDAAEGQAARALFLMMAGRLSKNDVVSAWEHAALGIPSGVLKSVVDEADITRQKMLKESDEVRFSVYNIQRQFIGFLEKIGLREEAVPDNRGEVVFYNLAKFSQAISDFEAIHFHSAPDRKYDSFAGFLEHQAEKVYADASTEEHLVSPDAVQIMTIHKAKGLQWPVVFVPQLMRNRFPPKARGGRTVWHLLPANGIVDQPRFLGSKEDERRLYYVAITRSQKHLHLTSAPHPDNRLYQQPSDFWNDVLESKYVKRRAQDYSKRARGKPEPRRSVSDMTLSFSDVKYFFECPYQFKLRILCGFNAPLDEALGYGKSLHDALAELHARAIGGEKITDKIASELVERHLRVLFAYPTLRETMKKAAKAIVSEYIANRKDEFDKIEFSEKQIEVVFGDGVSVSGRIDLVRRRDTNEVAIVDLKSNKDAQAPELTDNQLHIYALGYKELTGRNADYVETYELDQQKRISRAVDDEVIAHVTKEVYATAKALREAKFPPRPTDKGCNRCDFKRMCSAGSKHLANIASGSN
jgi:DNA helicase-2/ATP-dependent DNA helicase PcrA